MIITDSMTPEEDVKTQESSAAGDNSAAGGKDGTAESREPKQDVKKADENMFSDKNILSDEKVYMEMQPGSQVNLGMAKKEVVITPSDKVAFIDSVVKNERFVKDYSLFGGRIKLTVRSLTTDEVNAIAAWTIKQGTEDPNGLSSGRYRKFLAAAQVAKFNGVEMPPLEEPLFEHLGKDGKTVEKPGWVGRFAYWDGMEYGLFNSVMKCLSDFDLLYSAMCRKAEDANFWNPGTL